MKTFWCAVALFALVGLTLPGCGDQSSTPVAPDGQDAQATAPMAKVTARDFTGEMRPTTFVDPGFTKYPDGKVIIRGMMQNIQFDVTFADGGPDLLSGVGTLESNATADPSTGVGHFWGKLTLTPAAAEALGGVWELSWNAKGTLGPSGWTIPLKELGHGSGGALTGMQCFFDHVITAAPDFSYWTGAASGYVQGH